MLCLQETRDSSVYDLLCSLSIVSSPVSLKYWRKHPSMLCLSSGQDVNAITSVVSARNKRFKCECI